MSEVLPARMRALGSELASLRARAELTTRQAAARIGTSIASLNRIERAKRAATVAEVSAMLAIYGVVGEDRKRIIATIEKAVAAGWLETDHQLKELFPALVAFESKACSILHFAPANVPGLLQTPRYARAIISDVVSENVDERVADRLDRQEVLTKRGAPNYLAILDEAVLRRPIGGSHVIAEQIRWMIERSKLPNVDIRVIPFKYSQYGSPGYFGVFGFTDAPTVVYVEHRGASGFLDSPEGKRKLQDQAARLAKIALDSADSVKFLAMVAADHERS